MTETGPKVCEVCGAAPLQIVLHPVAVHYKGSGFYSTDYGRKSKQPSKDGGSGDSSSGSSGGDSGGEFRLELRPRAAAREEGRRGLDGAPSARTRATPGKHASSARFSTIDAVASPTGDVFAGRLHPVPRVGGG